MQNLKKYIINFSCLVWNLNRPNDHIQRNKNKIEVK